MRKGAALVRVDETEWRRERRLIRSLRPNFAVKLTLSLLVSVSFTTVLRAGVTAWVEGNTIWVTVSGTDPSSQQCCIGADIDEDPGFSPVGSVTTRFAPTINAPRPSKAVTDAACSIPCGTSSQTLSFGCNSVGPHTVYGYYADDHTGGYRLAGTATVNVILPPPAFCPQFVLTGGGTNLTHKYADGLPDITYPGVQINDGEMPLKIKTIAAPAGTIVYLRVYDPPDDSPYGAPHTADDNIDGGAGTLNGSTRMTTVTLPASGSVPVVLKTTLFASGDNYEVAASASPTLHDPSTVCDATIACQKQKVSTFKRFYVEANEMYRESHLLQTNVLVGDRLVYVNDRGFRKGDQVRLIHAPSYLRDQLGDVDGFYFEDRVVVNAGRNRNPAIAAQFEIELDAPVTKWFGTDRPAAGVPLGDALVNMSRNGQHSSDPMYRVNTSYIRNAFWYAYADLVPLASNGVGIPLYANMADTTMIFVGAKWFAGRRSPIVPPNTGLAVAAGTRAALANVGQLSLGTTGGPFSYVWRANIDDATAGPRSRFPLLSGHDPDRTSGEVLVHELAHQWNVNAGYPDHECTQNSYDSAAFFCQGNGPQNSGQYDDSHIAFHYLKPTPTTPPSGADSEYITIRTASEPRPQ